MKVVRRGLAIGAVALVTAGSASAQEVEGIGPSRADDLVAAREARAAKIEPFDQPWVVKALDTIETDGADQLVSFQAGDWRFGFGSISPVSGITPALRYEKPRIGISELSFRLAGAYSTRQFQAYEAQLGIFKQPAPSPDQEIGFLGHPFDLDHRARQPVDSFLYVEGVYHNFPQERFWGVGSGSSEDDETNYRYETGRVNLVGGWQPQRWIGLLGRVGYLHPNVGPGTNEDYPSSDELFDETTAPGVTIQEDFLHFNGELTIAYLDDPNRPAGELGVGFSRYNDIDADRFAFNQFFVDARGFLPLGSRQRTLAVRMYASHADPDEGSQVPFYLMEPFGGNRTVRGFQDLRFRDVNQFLVSVEYRWEATASVELAAFYDSGKTFDADGKFDFNGHVHAWGGGIRARALRRVAFRLDIGHGDEGTFVYLKFGPSF